MVKAVADGFRLPVCLGGSEDRLVRSLAWIRVPGSGIAPIDGNRVPSHIAEWGATVRCEGGVTGRLRLFNRTTGQQVGQEVSFSADHATVVLCRRITLPPGINEYELQIRLEGPPAGAFRQWGVAAWGVLVGVGD